MKRNSIFKIIGRQIIIWTIAFTFFNFIREYGQVIERPDDAPALSSLSERILFQLLIGVVSGILFGTYEYFLNKYITNRMSFGKVVSLGSIGYVFVIVFFIFMAYAAYGLFFGVSIKKETLMMFFTSGGALVVITYCLIVGFTIEFMKQVDKKFGPGILIKMMLGKFYEPKEEKRIFMFLDMRSSTTIAEKLGHIKYSQLVQDCFRDIGVVLNYKAEIYQYVGDEAVLTWSSQKGLQHSNCIQAYFAFSDKLKDRSEYYNKTYGLIPEFKAGINIGQVTVAEVGEVKREIAYHGDTINTAARIQSMCNEYGEDLLVSDDIIAQLAGERVYPEKLVGEVKLRGKKEATKIYSIANITS